MTEISNPHDKFFKEVFTRKASTEEFLRHYLPENVVGLLDLDSLEYTKDTFVDRHLKEYFSDLLLKLYLKDGSPGYVYILFEHKSYQEPLIAFHILRYMVKIWEKKNEPGFPVIIPIALYHGKTRWRVGLNFRDLFDSPEEIASYIPDFQYLLWDASGYSDEEIKGGAVLRVALLVLKYIFREDLREHLPGILSLLRNLSEKRTSIEYIETILKYIVNAASTENIDREDMKAAVDEALSHRGGEIMPTIADSLRQEGIQQGIQQSAREAVIDILEVHFDVVPGSIDKTINGIDDPSILKMLLKKAATVDSLDGFKRVMERVMS